MSILVSTDGTQYSEKAVRFAIEIAKCRRTPLVILHIVRSKRGVESEKIVKDGMQLLERIRTVSTAHGVETLTFLESGVVFDIILAKAEETGAEMIVLGSSGNSHETQLIGSTSEHVVHNAKCSVAVVK